MKVSIILPESAEYLKFVPEARQSIHDQTVPVEMISIVSGGNVAKATNEGVRRSTREYVMRLDCDDILHPMAAEIMSNYLDFNPDVAAVYSDYWKTTEGGAPVKVVSQDGIPHPGCMMIRREAFERIGGFNEDLSRQEGTDFYFRLKQHYQIDHITIPLWYYRRHGQQMSNAHNEVVKARHEVKEMHKSTSVRILAIIPARGGSKGIPRKNLVELNGAPLVTHAIRLAKLSKHDILVVASTEDREIADVARAEGVMVHDRNPVDAKDDVNLITVAKRAMYYMGPQFRADIVVTIQPTAPWTPVFALDNALSRMIANPKLDAVVSMSEVLGKHPYRMYRHFDKRRFMPFFPDKAEKFLQRQDRDPAYQFTGGFYARRRRLLEDWNGEGLALGNWEGELVPQQAGIDIDTKFDLWLAQAMLTHQEEL